MDSTLHTINAVANWIPSKVRGVIYTLIGLFWLVNEIWDFVPSGSTGSKIMLTLSLVAAIMAAGNTDLVPDRPLPPPAPDGDRGESTLMTIVLVLVIVVLVIFLLGVYR